VNAVEIERAIRFDAAIVTVGGALTGQLIKIIRPHPSATDLSP
jgi:hypothetical protein